MTRTVPAGAPGPGGEGDRPSRGGGAASPSPGSLLARLLDAPVRPGRLEWIGLRPARRVPMLSVVEATLVQGEGLEGDRWRGRPEGARQVTLVSAEHLAAIAGFLGLASVSPERLRRNLVVRGLNLAALRGRRIAVGDAVLEAGGPCAPCSRMEEEFGPGGYSAVLHHGGIVARVLQGGRIALGDPVCRLDPEVDPR